MSMRQRMTVSEPRPGEENGGWPACRVDEWWFGRIAALSLAVLAGVSLLAAPAVLAAPTVSVAALNGTDLTMTFTGGTLDNAASPPSTAFAAKVNNRTAAVSTEVNMLVVPGLGVNQVVVKLAARAAKEDTVTLTYTEPSTNPLQDTNGNKVANFTDKSFTNNTGQGPTYQSATVDGATLDMRFNQRLDETSVPAASVFTVTVGSDTRTVSSVAVSQRKVTLTLASAVTSGDAVKVRYTRPLDGTNMVQAHSGFHNVVASFSDKTVTNNTPPVFSSAAVDGTQLTATFDVNLKASSVPVASAFTVTVGTTSGTVSNVSLAGKTVTLTLASAVTDTDSVTVGYTKPSTGSKLQDASGNEVATFSDKTVTNNTGPPNFSSAAVDGTQLTVTFSEDLKASSVPAASAFTVTVGTVSRTVSGVALSGKVATLTLASAVESTDTVMVRYTKPTSGDTLKDAGDNEVATFADQTATNNSVVPTVSSAAVNGNYITVTFSEAVVLGSEFPVEAFTVSAGGIERPGHALSGSNPTSPEIYLDSVPVAPEDTTVTLSYTRPASDPVSDTAGNVLASFSGQQVTNNTPADAAPVFYRGTVNGATLVMTFNASLKTTSTPATGTFTVTVGATTRTVSNVSIAGKTVTLTLASAVTPDDTVKVRYTKPTTGDKLQGSNDAEVETFTIDETVTNETEDTTAPSFSSASVNGSTLAVTFDEALDTGSAPAGSAFTVTATESGTARTINGSGTVSIDTATPAVATVTLGSPVTAADTVQVRYTKPTNNPLQDANANAVATFANQSVTNATAPVFESATVDGSTLTVTFDANLDATSSPAGTHFTVTVGTDTRSVNSVSIATRGVTLTLASAVTAADTTVKVRYTKPASNPLKGSNGTDVATFADQSVTNATAPALSGATVDGATLTVTFDVDLDTGSVPAPGDFFVTVAGSRRDVATNGVAISTTDSKNVTLTLASAVMPDDAVTFRYTKPASNPLKGGNGTDVATFADQTVTNRTAPVLVSAAVNGADLTVVFDVALRDDSVPAPGDFTVTVTAGGVPATRTVSSVGIEAATVTLTLASAVIEGDTVQVRYTKPSSNPLKANANDAEVATFTNQNVTNDTDSTAPSFVSASVDGAALTVTFNEDLDSTSVPAGSDFTVTVGGEARTVNAVAIDAATPAVVTLTLASAVTLTDTVQVRYTQPTTGAKLRDPAGNPVATFDQNVTNATTPVFESAVVNKETLTLTFDEALDESSVPAPGDFHVTVGTNTRRDVAANGVAIDEETVTLTLASAVVENQTVKVRYTKPASNPLKDLVGHEVATFGDKDVTNVTDDTAPQYQSATVNDATLTLLFDEALDTGSVPRGSDFTVTVDSDSGTVNAVAIDAATPTEVTLTLASAVTDTATVTLGYTEPTSNPLTDAAGNAVATFAGEAVTNLTADKVAPVFQSATVSGATLDLDFDEALDAGSEPAPGAFFVTVENARRTVATNGVDVSEATVTLNLSSAVAAGDAVRVRYAKPSNRPLTDAAGNAVNSFSDQRVANRTVDTTAPAFQRAAVDGKVLTLTFDEALDPDSVPSPDAFTATVGGAPRALVPDNRIRRGVALVGATAVLRLVSAVTDTAVVEVRYTQPGSNPLRDDAGNPVAAFPNQTVSNDTSALPVLVHATVNGEELIVTFNKAIILGDGTGFRVRVNGTRRSTGQTAVGGDELVEFDLSPPVTSRDAVTLSYTRSAATVKLEDGAGNEVASFSNKPVTNLTPDEAAPVLAGAVVRGATLTLTFDEPLDANALPPEPSAFTVAGTETSTTVVAVAFHPTDDTRLLLRLRQAVAPGPSVTVSYTRPASNPLRDRAGNEMADFENEPLRVPPAPPPPPPPPPPPALHTVPSFVGGDTAELSIVRLHGDGAPVGTVAATDADGDPLVYSLAGNDRAFFTIDATGLVAVAPGTALAGEGRDHFTVTAEVSDGENALGLPEPTPAIDDTIEVTITLADTREHRVALVPSASDPHHRQGFVRVVNHSAEAGEVSILAIDDAGLPHGPATLDLEAHRTVHFNSRDLEQGNAGKGLEDGTGPGEGRWRLVLTSALDLEVLSYIRTDDGFVTSMHDVAPEGEAGHRVVFFNPGSNRRQVSWLRLVNPGEAAVDITIEGTDDAGEAGEIPVELTLGAGASRALSAQALESGQGEGLLGRLGDGMGKWRLDVSAPQPIRVMSLLASPTGHLTNLSATPRKRATGAAAISHRVPLAPSASDPHYRQGFVRVVNHSGEAGEVSITAIDDAGVSAGPVTLDIDAHQTVHFNSGDLERGNPYKGLEDGTGPGEGSWRLVLASSLDLEVLSYIRTEDGFVTSMHDLTPSSEAGHRVVFFNPGSNRNQVSWLRLINPGEAPADITIEGTDDAGESGESPVTLTLPARASRTLSAQSLELGDEGFDGALGDGKGKWRLDVSAPQPIRVMSLLASPTGHLTNLSAAPGRP